MNQNPGWDVPTNGQQHYTCPDPTCSSPTICMIRTVDTPNGRRHEPAQPADYRTSTPGPYTSPQARPDLPYSGQASKPPVKHKGLMLLGALAGLTILGLAVSAGNDHTAVDVPNSSAASPRPTITAKAPQTLPTGRITTAPVKPKAVEQAPKTIPGDGTWIVGTDVAPGRYRAVVPGDSLVCSWERLKADGDLIDIGVGEPGESMVVTVKASDSLLKVDNCGKWKRVS